MRLALTCTILLSAGPLLSQTSSELAQHFAGCYQMRVTEGSLNGKGLPQRFQLLAQTVSGSASWFAIKTSDPKDPNWMLSTWKPKSEKQLVINWSMGLGGYHAKLTKKGGTLAGKAKFWCDVRCAFKTPKFAVEAHSVPCESELQPITGFLENKVKATR